MTKDKVSSSKLEQLFGEAEWGFETEVGEA